MEQSKMLEMLKCKDEAGILEFLDVNGKLMTLSYSAEFLNKRAYLTIDTAGNIKRKRGSMALPIFAFLNDKNSLVKELLNSSDSKERQKIDKIERFSSMEIEKVKSNLIKTLFNGNLEFSKKYGKELFLRDRESFFKIVSNFALIGNLNSLKPLFVLSIKKLLTEYDENIFYNFISYMTKYRDDLSTYEEADIPSKSLEELKKIVKTDEKLLNSIEGLGVLSSIKVLEEIDVDNREKVIRKLEVEIEKCRNYTQLSENESKLLEFFL